MAIVIEYNFCHTFAVKRYSVAAEK